MNHIILIDNPSGQKYVVHERNSTYFYVVTKNVHARFDHATRIYFHPLVNGHCWLFLG